jgi:predicted DNA-binding protein
MPRQSLDGIRTHIILTKVQDKRLRKIADDTGMTLSEHVRRAVDHYITVNEPRPGEKRAR